MQKQWRNYIEAEETNPSLLFHEALPLKIHLPYPLIIVGGEYYLYI